VRLMALLQLCTSAPAARREGAPRILPGQVSPAQGLWLASRRGLAERGPKALIRHTVMLTGTTWITCPPMPYALKPGSP
jgi:hypothetical protein